MDTIKVEPAKMITPEKKARMDADAAKPLPGAPPVRAASRALTPQEAAATAKSMRERMQIFKDASDKVLGK